MRRSIPLLTGLLALGALAVGAALAGDDPAPAAPSTPPTSAQPEREVGTAVGNTIPQFTVQAQDLSGEEPRAVEFDSHKREHATVYVFMSRSCPWCNLYKARLATMSKEYAKKGVEFVTVYPTRATPVEQKVAHFKETGFGGLFLNDVDARVAAQLKITKTPEVMVVKKDGEIVFRGGIDDSPQDVEGIERAYLKDAIDAVLAGKEVETTGAPLYG